MKNFDHEWIEKIKARDQRVMTYLYNSLRSVVYNTIYNITKSTELTEDLTNDCFIKIFENIEKYREDTNFKSWVKAMATNLAIDHYRKPDTKRTINTIDDEDDYSVLTDSISPESEIIDIEDVSLLQESIQKLDPAYSNVLRLLYFENKSYREIADELGKPINTVKSTVFKGKQKLKKLLIK